MILVPTMKLKWLSSDCFKENKNVPYAYQYGYEECGADAFVLCQFWENPETGEGEWIPIEIEW